MRNGAGEVLEDSLSMLVERYVTFITYRITQRNKAHMVIRVGSPCMILTCAPEGPPKGNPLSYRLVKLYGHTGQSLAAVRLVVAEAMRCGVVSAKAYMASS